MLNVEETYKRLEELVKILGYEIDNPENSLIGSFNIVKKGKQCGKVVREEECDLDGFRLIIKDELLDINHFNPMLDYGMDQDEKRVDITAEKFYIRNCEYGVDIFLGDTNDEFFTVYNTGNLVAHSIPHFSQEFSIFRERDKDSLGDIEDEVYQTTGFDLITSAINLYRMNPKKRWSKRLIFEP